MRRILVTGATGFVGKHLLALLRSITDLEVVGTSRRPAAPGSLSGPCGWYVGDLTDREFTDNMIRDIRPDLVAHLAAQSAVMASWKDPQTTLVNNLVAQLNVLESLASHVPEARALVVGSSEEYGPVQPRELPLTEESPLRPNSPYALSKVIQDFLGLQYYLGRRLRVIRVRAFNLIGPGQDERFAISSFARQIAAAELGLGPRVIRVGNLEARRDFTDVRDAVQAYLRLLEIGTAGDVYNVGGGSNRSMREVLDTLIGLSRVPLEVEIDPSRLRPSDVPIVESDVRKIQDAVHWTPTISFEQTLRDTLDEWRERMAAAQFRTNN